MSASLEHFNVLREFCTLSRIIQKELRTEERRCFKRIGAGWISVSCCCAQTVRPVTLLLPRPTTLKGGCQGLGLTAALEPGYLRGSARWGAHFRDGILASDSVCSSLQDGRLAHIHFLVNDFQVSLSARPLFSALVSAALGECACRWGPDHRHVRIKLHWLFP
ncbi:hypothetical protein NDU88_000242 [Pleurodeles waltl]|uniref:Uncharacterized protein n=1 Tax=Pleurodeles waltl TaxID=8319 RepID=A0AAV7KPC9_PLEWA|nr:hypothetical protein NDU88_000242 [Pleurodeles waltl]